MSQFSIDLLGQEFTSLFGKKNIYTESRRNKIERFQQSQAKALKDLEFRLRTKAYSPNLRGTLISQKKPDGKIKVRGITPSDPEDWIVQRILLRLINEDFGSRFATPVSYGRRPQKFESGRSPAECCRRIAEARELNPYCFQADLVEFFPSINREILKENLSKHIPLDWEHWWLLERFIDSDALPDKKATSEQVQKFWPKGKGVHQGTVLAPFLANAIMLNWDRIGEESGLVFRYVDDWLILGPTLESLRADVPRLIAALPEGVVCHLDDPSKSKWSEPSESIQFLGLCIDQTRKVRPGQKAIQGFDEKLQSRTTDAKDMVSMAVSLRRFHQAWINYYSQVELNQSLKEQTKNKVEASAKLWLKENTNIAASELSKVWRELSKYKAGEAESMTQSVGTLLIEGEIRPSEVTDTLARLA